MFWVMVGVDRSSPGRMWMGDCDVRWSTGILRGVIITELPSFHTIHQADRANRYCQS